MSVKGQLICDTCGSDNHFETNDDKTYVKCHACGREYFGVIMNY